MNIIHKIDNFIIHKIHAFIDYLFDNWPPEVLGAVFGFIPFLLIVLFY